MGYWAEMWVPLMTYAQVMSDSENLLEQQNSRWLLLMGRMQTGMKVANAQERTSAFARQLGEKQTGSEQLASATVIPAATQFDNPSWVSRRILTFGATRCGIPRATKASLATSFRRVLGRWSAPARL